MGGDCESPRDPRTHSGPGRAGGETGPWKEILRVLPSSAGLCIRSYPHDRAAFLTCWLRSASAGLGAVPGLRETHPRTRWALPSNPPGGHTCKPAEDPTFPGLGGMEACMALEGGKERGREALTQTGRLEQAQEEFVPGPVFKAEAESERLHSLTCPHLSQW